jgi:Protein of unknown function (DUF742)
MTSAGFDDETSAGERTRPRLARPYAVVGGRTESSQPKLAVETLVSTTGVGVTSLGALALESREIAMLCRTPQSLAEVAARLRLPYGVARVLVGDLVGSGVVTVYGHVDDGPSDETLEKVLDALRTR